MHYFYRLSNLLLAYQPSFAIILFISSSNISSNLLELIISKEMCLILKDLVYAIFRIWSLKIGLEFFRHSNSGIQSVLVEMIV